MHQFKTAQEQFWAGSFGDAYIDRNKSAQILASKVALFSRVLARTSGIRSILELGANIGLNLVALRHLLPAAELHGLEINAKAFSELRALPNVKATHGSILDFRPSTTVDLSFTSGVLIHIDPAHLKTAYQCLYEATIRYCLVVEYYNPVPIEVRYRGHDERLFKRDWAGDLMDTYPDLKLIDYGFGYRRDPVFPMDDATWFLMQRAPG